MADLIYQIAFVAGVILFITGIKKLAWSQVHKISWDRANNRK